MFFQHPAVQEPVPVHVNLGSSTVIDHVSPVVLSQIVISFFTVVPSRTVCKKLTDDASRPSLRDSVHTGPKLRICCFDRACIDHLAGKIPNRITGFVIDNLVGVGDHVFRCSHWNAANGCRFIDVRDLIHVVGKNSVLSVIICVPIRFADVIQIRRNVIVRQHFAFGMVSIAVWNDPTVTVGVSSQNDPASILSLNVLQTALTDFCLNVRAFELFFDILDRDNYRRTTGYRFPVREFTPRRRQFFVGDHQQVGTPHGLRRRSGIGFLQRFQTGFLGLCRKYDAQCQPRQEHYKSTSLHGSHSQNIRLSFQHSNAWI